MSATARESRPDAGPARTRWRWLLALASVILAAVVAAPVVLAPVNADDRYWYMMIAARSNGSLLEVFHWSWQALPAEIASGRIASLASVQRRIVGLGAMEASIATAIPVVIYQALVKIVLLLAGVAASVAMVASLRWRTREGDLVRAAPGTLWLVGIALPMAVAAGAQAQGQFRNGWTSYPVLTYGAVAAIFGSVATVLWLTRLTAERPRVFAVPSVLGLFALAVLTSVSYEMVYPAVVVSAIALVVVPLTDRADRRAGVRAKALTGGAYVGGFLGIFTAIRVYLARWCSTNECYEGVTPNLGPEAIAAAARSFLTSLTLGNGEETLADFDRVGWADRYPVDVTLWSVALAGLVLVLLLVSWRSQVVSAEEASPDAARAEGLMLLVGALLAGSAAIGTTLVLSLSVQAQEILSVVGVPYRNTMVTWTSLALAVILAALGLAVLGRPQLRVLPWTAVALMVALLVASSLPTNAMLTRAYRVLPSLQATEAIHYELALGDTSAEAKARRCARFDRVVETMGEGYTRSQIFRQANRAFVTAHGEAFCDDTQYPR